MSSLTKNLETIITDSVKNFIERVCSSHKNINNEELCTIWNNMSYDIKITANKKVITSKESSTEVKTCPYEFIKGAKQGLQCGSKTKEGNVYCTRHKKYENIAQKTIKHPPCVANPICLRKPCKLDL